MNSTTARPVPVAILVRVSTDKQTTDRQTAELQAHAAAQGWNVVAICEETLSGTTAGSDRTGLQAVRELVTAGTIRKVLVHEVSRLSRRPSVVHSFVEEMEQAGVSLYWHAQRIETMLPSGKRNPAAAIMLALLAEMARAETDTLRERIKSGLDAARRKGVTLGRKTGSTVPMAVFLAKPKDVVRLLKEGHRLRNAAKISGKGGSTVQRVKSLMN
jgi:DNA invertase Pin-like site-specific DNA recombinase